MDTVSRAKRSKIMAAIKSSGTRSTELRLRAWLVSKGIRGWTTNGQGLPGTLDIVFPKKKIAIFVDGCFWHGCIICSRNITPSTNARFWSEKISANQKRDRRVVRFLRASGWGVIRIWEHDLKKDRRDTYSRIQSLTV
jgi:DNA mismatch endonuclease (patch repair protein)